MNGFHRVSLKPRVFERVFTDKINKVYGFKFTRTAIATASTTAIKFYNCNGEVYGYCADKTVRKSEGLMFPSVNFNSNVTPLIIGVTVNGVQKVMFVNDERAVIDGETVSGVPYGSSAAQCGGRIFIADGYKLKYSDSINITDLSEGLNFGGFIEIDKNSGEILYLSEDAGSLYVIAERSIYKLLPCGATYEFTLQKISDNGLNIVKNSVYGEGGRIGFLNGSIFCVLRDGKISEICDTLEDYDNITINGVAGGYGSLYVLAFTSNRSKYAFAYDYRIKQAVVEPVNNYTVSGEYTAIPTDIRYYRISIVLNEVTVAENYLGEYDFGTCAKKAICRIRAHIFGSCTMTVTGDGTFTATINERCNDVPCFLHGKNFIISFDNASSDFKLSKLAVQYVIYGE